MPTYESENGWFVIVNQKNYWSIYTHRLEKFSKCLTTNPDEKYRKGRINHRNKDDVDLDVMRQVIKQPMLG